MDRLFTLIKFQFLSTGSQSIFYWFWPIFKNLAPLITGFIAFGQILEQNSGDIPFKYWVASGAIVWIPISTGLNLAGTIFSSSFKRRRFNIANISTSNLLLSNFMPTIFLIFMFWLPCSYFAFKEYTFKEAIVKNILSLMLMCLVLLLSINLTYQLGILVALTRDVKFILPWIASALLFTSPVFYTPRIPNSLMEHIIAVMNPMIRILELDRAIIFNKPLNLGFTFAVFWVCISTFIILSTCSMKSGVARLVFALNQRYELDEID